MTVIAALAGGALAPLLPILTNALASGRQQLRVESALEKLSQVLLSHGDRLNDISDNKYKLINEIVLTLLQTVDQDKIDVLRNSVANVLVSAELSSHETYFLSRLVRDISVQEVRFLQRNFAIERISLVSREPEASHNSFEININSEDGRLAAGLISLGVFAAVGGIIKDLGTYRFTPIAAKLLTLLQNAA